MFTTKKQAEKYSGSLSKTSKMPGKSWGIAALGTCKVGTKLSSVHGSVCENCYACKGGYQWRNVENAHRVRLEHTMHEEWVPAMIKMLEGEEYFRWHDSGDLYSEEYLHKIMEIIRGTPATLHWLPTKEKALITNYIKQHGLPGNVVVRLSGYMVDAKPPRTITGLLTSTVHTGNNVVGHECPAHKQEGRCGSCRACWDNRVANVSYLKH